MDWIDAINRKIDHECLDPMVSNDLTNIHEFENNSK